MRIPKKLKTAWKIAIDLMTLLSFVKMVWDMFTGR